MSKVLYFCIILLGRLKCLLLNNRVVFKLVLCDSCFVSLCGEIIGGENLCKWVLMVVVKLYFCNVFFMLLMMCVFCNILMVLLVKVMVLFFFIVFGKCGLISISFEKFMVLMVCVVELMLLGLLVLISMKCKWLKRDCFDICLFI